MTNAAGKSMIDRQVRVVVVGSLNHDITVWVPHRPGPDETLHGDRVAEFRGGKGANQAVAAARLDADVLMVGCVGTDARAEFLVSGLDQDKIDRRYVSRAEAPTGVAFITVDPDDVSIVVVAGANGELTSDLVVEAAAVIADADVLLLQGESPTLAAVSAARIARDAGTLVVFNPAPYNEVAAAVVPYADVLMVNRHEAQLLADDVGEVAVPIVVTTLGADGALVAERGVETMVPAFTATVVDPTGAGDCFAAAFSVRFAEAGDAIEAATFAAAAGACAVETAGAQPSLPTRAQVQDRLAT